MEELSLLVWLGCCNKKKLIKLLCKYTGCEPEVYTGSQLIRLLEDTLIDISRKYHLKNVLYEYFYARRVEKVSILFNPKKGNETTVEINALISAIFSIRPKVFDVEDLDKIKELKKEYLEECKKYEQLCKN